MAPSNITVEVVTDDSASFTSLLGEAMGIVRDAHGTGRAVNLTITQKMGGKVTGKASVKVDQPAAKKPRRRR